MTNRTGENMNNPISISFKHHKYEESINFHSQHDGNELLQQIQDYIQELQEENMQPNTPLGRKEPTTVILDFIIWYIGDQEGNEDNYSLTNTKSENHHTYNLTTQQWEPPKRP